jgi:uncharacterized protein
LGAVADDAVAPLPPSERLPLVDVLRGVAILGVLASYTLWSLGTAPESEYTRADRGVDWLADLLIDGKFITLFAFMFGVGTSQQWRRFEAAGRHPLPLHFRRMTFLLAVGALHALLLRDGDILAPYALLGMALFIFRPFPSRALVASALLLLVLPYVLQLAFARAGWHAPPRPGPDAGNIGWLRYWYATNPFFSWPRVLGLMVLGVAADRVRLLPRMARDRGLAWRVFAIGLLVAVIARLVVELLTRQMGGIARTTVQDIVFFGAHHVAAWALAATYVGGFALLCQRPGWADRLFWLRAEGRMAFTNYVLQAGIAVPICLAFGLFDTVRPTFGLELALGIAVVQIAFSVWWLRRHPFGPLEWLWRVATYGRRPRPVLASTP